MNRAVSTTRSVIETIAIAASGVWVTKHLRRSGAVLQRAGRLSVGGADCTRVVERLDWHVAAVANVLGDTVPIHAAVVVDGARWPLHSGPLCVGSTWVLWQEALESLIAEAGPLSPVDVQRVHALLERALPVALPDAG
jgi:hypothetical protein